MTAPSRDEEWYESRYVATMVVFRGKANEVRLLGMEAYGNGQPGTTSIAFHGAVTPAEAHYVVLPDVCSPELSTGTDDY